MSFINTFLKKGCALVAISAIITMTGFPTVTNALSLADTPLFVTSGATPLNLLVMGRDHKLYYEAYNDHSDLDEDGVIDVRFKPSIEYFGYFDSNTCYNHSGSQFNPAAAAATSGTDLRACSGQWSGNFLNYMTTSRIDALRKVLYGGYRSTDSAASTVLERAYIPQDAHSWGKEYTSVAVDGYSISNYTPYGTPTAGTRHLFANVTRLNSIASGPLLRVLTNRTERIWNWVSTERAVAGFCLGNGQQTGGTNGCQGGSTTIVPNDLAVRVSVCIAGYDQAKCKQYPSGNYKPTGLLQQYGESDTMKFGLLSGSYQHNTDGGVLRKAVASIKSEINWSTDGTFISGANGVIQTLNNFRSTGFTVGNQYAYTCGWITTRAINDGECQMWGNPVAEMMYEGLRYFAGKSAPTTDFNISVGAGEESGLNLPVATWNAATNPYSAANGNGTCAKPVQTVISDVNTSYDTNKLPGVDANFGAFTGDLTGLNVSTLGQTIWNNEFGVGSKNIFIGQSGALVAGAAGSAPTAKAASSFGNIRGLAPEEPTKQGGYYAASVAYFGQNTDLNLATGTQKSSTFAVALASPLPRIEITNPISKKKITLIPFAKSVGGSGISATSAFQPTNQIVDFYVETLTATTGRFRINYEDVEQGADHDMDAIVVYEYIVNGDGTVTVTLTSEYAAGGIIQHMGYVISGTTADGIYLDVRDVDTAAASDINYSLDTPNDVAALPLTSTRTFTPGATTGAELLNNPLWYAAKYGGFTDSNGSGMPDLKSEWDEDNDGDPDNYFLVTNALTLGAKLSAAFNEILARVGSASSATVNSGSVSSTSRVYQAKFNSGDWSGNLFSYTVGTDGAISTTAEWDAASRLPADSTTRSIFTVGSETIFTPKSFDWAAIGTDSVRKAQLGTTDTIAEDILDYVRGDDSNEANKAGPFSSGPYRIRTSKLGDIVNSAPLYVGPPSFSYSDSLEASNYSTFAVAKNNRKPAVYVGANDGMLHAFDASDGVNEGKELFAFIPSPVFGNLKNLATTPYAHQYFVDGSPNMGDVYFGGQWRTVLLGGLNKGGQGIYALDVTDPTNFSASKVLWEFTDKNDSDLGYTFSRPQIVRLKSGKWAAIFGNGYNNSMADSYTSASGRAVLYVVDISNGSIIKKFDTGVGSTSTPNGLATPTVIDENGDKNADYVYAGDLQGNMWKFDIRDANVSNWSIPFTSGSNPAPLYVAQDSSGNRQPITSRAEVSRGTDGLGLMILFGTGQWLELTDKIVVPSKPQTFYGIYDPNTGAASDSFTGRGQLSKQEIKEEKTITQVDGTTIDVRQTTSNSIGARGWYMDLIPPGGVYKGERVVSNPILRNGRVIFSTLAPDTDPCSFGGDSWIMELNLLTGGRLTTISPVDVNGDGQINSSDYVTFADGTTAPVGGIKSEVGITPEPGVLSGVGSALEYKYSAGSSGEIQTTVESGLPTGRQSWRQLR